MTKRLLLYVSGVANHVPLQVAVMLKMDDVSRVLLTMAFPIQIVELTAPIGLVVSRASSL